MELVKIKFRLSASILFKKPTFFQKIFNMYLILIYLRSFMLLDNFQGRVFFSLFTKMSLKITLTETNLFPLHKCLSRSAFMGPFVGVSISFFCSGFRDFHDLNF